MGTAIITVSSGGFSADAALINVGGAAPPDVIPTVTHMNGFAVDQYFIEGTGQMSNYGTIESFRPFQDLQSLDITGTDLQQVTAIQLDYACPYTGFAFPGQTLQPDMPIYNFAVRTGKIVIPDVPSSINPALAFTVVDNEHIRIPYTTFQTASWGLPTPLPGFANFPNYMLDVNFPANSHAYLEQENNAQPYDLINTRDVWWRLRLWYESGTHYIEPTMFVRFDSSVPTPPQFYGYDISAVPPDSVGPYAAGYRFSYVIGGGVLGTAPNDVVLEVSSSGLPLPLTSSTDLTNATSPDGWADIVLADDYYGTVWAKSTNPLPDVTYKFQDFSIAVTTPPLINSVSHVGSAWTVSGINFTQYFGGTEASSFIVAGIYDYPSYLNGRLADATYVSDDTITFTGVTNLVGGNQYVLGVFRTDDNADNDPAWWTGWDIGNPINMGIVFEEAPTLEAIDLLTMAAPTSYRDNPILGNLEPFPFRSGTGGDTAAGMPPTGWKAFGLNNTSHRYSISYFETPFDACGATYPYVLDQTSSIGNWIADGNGVSGTAHYGASTYPTISGTDGGGWRQIIPDLDFIIGAPGLGNFGGAMESVSSWTRIPGYNYTFQSTVMTSDGVKHGKACSGGNPNNTGKPRIGHFIGRGTFNKDFTTVTAVKQYNSSGVYMADIPFKSKGTKGIIVWLDPAVSAGDDVYMVFESPSAKFKSPKFDVQA